MYLDPGSWSIVVQVLLGLLLGVPVLIGVHWGRIKHLFSKVRKSNAGSNKE